MKYQELRDALEFGGSLNDTFKQRMQLRALLAERDALRAACEKMIEWDDRENDHAVDFDTRMALCIQSFELAHAALSKGDSDDN